MFPWQKSRLFLLRGQVHYLWRLTVRAVMSHRLPVFGELVFLAELDTSQDRTPGGWGSVFVTTSWGPPGQTEQRLWASSLYNGLWSPGCSPFCPAVFREHIFRTFKIAGRISVLSFLRSGWSHPGTSSY